MNKEKIVITGSSGFIGKALAKRLVAMGHEVIKMGRAYYYVDCDRIYHLACPSATEVLQKDPVGVMNIIIKKTQEAVEICPNALFVNASTMGVVIKSHEPAQSLYNNAKALMEEFLKIVKAGEKLYNYRIPSVYGDGMAMSGYVGKCIKKEAYSPVDEYGEYEIIHIDSLVSSMANLDELTSENTTLINIYNEFYLGDRNINE
jgi:nucleoside-diphosphate-sugar epimerase